MNIDISLDIMKNIKKLSYEDKKRLLKQKDCSIEIIEELLKDVTDITYLVAKHPSLSKKRLKELALSHNYYIRKGVAENINSEKDILSKLLKLENRYENVRCLAVQNSNLSLEDLEELMLSEKFSKDFYIRKGIVLNINSSEEILDLLSKDEYSSIRKRVSLHENTSAETLIRLYEEFLDNVLKHPNCPEWIKVLSK